MISSYLLITNKSMMFGDGEGKLKAMHCIAWHTSTYAQNGSLHKINCK